MKKNLIYLDSYVLQQDMRIRLPKSILENIPAIKGISRFSVYLDKEDLSIVLKIEKKEGEKNV